MGRRPLQSLRIIAIAILLVPLVPLVGKASGASRDGVAFAAHESDSAATVFARDSLARVRDLVDRGRYRPAEALARRTIGVLRAASTPDSLALAGAMDLLLQALMRNGTRAGPEWFEIAREAVSIRERGSEPEGLAIAASLNRLANLLADSSSFVAAGLSYGRALAMLEKQLGPDHPRVAEVLLNLAILRRSAGDWRGARPLYDRAIAIWDRELGGQFPFLAQSVNSMVVGLWSSGDYGEARAYSERAVAVWEKTTGPDHPEMAESVRYAARLMQGTGDWKIAIPALEFGLATLAVSLGPDHPDLAFSYNTLAVMSMVMGQAQLSRRLYEMAIAVWERGLGPDHPELALGLTNLAHLLSGTGELPEARRVCERALKIREKALGPDHYLVAVSLDQLVNLLTEMGDMQMALPLAQRALEITERALGPADPQAASILGTLSHLRSRAGDLEGARRLQQRRLDIVVKSIGPDELETSNALSGLASVMAELGDHRTAREYGERALAIRETVYSRDHSAVAEILSDLAVQYRLTGEPDRAREMLTRAIGIQVSVLGSDHPTLATTLNRLARLLFAEGDGEAAADSALRAEAIGREHFRTTARVLPERQALALGAARASGLPVALSLLSADSEQQRKRVVLDALVRSRALVLDEMAARHRTLRASSDQGVDRLIGDFRAASARYATLLTRGPDAAHPERYRPLIVQARVEREQLEQALSERSAAYRREQRERSVGLNDVAAALEPGSGLLGFVVYPRLERGERSGGVPSYLAFLVRGGTDRVEVVPLGPACALDSLVVRWSDAVGRGVMHQLPKSAEAAYRRAGTALRERVWDPLVPFMEGIERVYVVPDGALNLVNLATLPLEDGSYLVEHGPLLHTLSAERDLITLGASVEQGHGLLTMGGPAYDARPGELRIASERQSKISRPLTVGEEASAYRGARSGCADFVARDFSPLSGTLREVREIGQLWKADHPSRPAGQGRADAGSVVELTGTQASERAFKQGAAGRAVLHLATHGFFITGRCRSALDGSTRGIGGVVIEREPQSAEVMDENPLVLSGLVMAGANRRSEASAEEEDGILTAEEIAALDLGGVEWAVLSACETGVGDVRAGEGVFGLRRAFQVAGARALIMSLWAVEDQAARAWMQELYRGRHQRGLGTAEAVRGASLTLLRERRAKQLSTHPFYWGAFVAAGDWR